jgi:hypothetical protein
MSLSILPVVIVAIFSLARKGFHLVSAIKQGNKDKVKVELFFFVIILALAAALILILY